MKPAGSPFNLDDRETYERWKFRKLAESPKSIGDLMVEVADPARITKAERAAILERIVRANMAIYITGKGEDPDREIPRAVMRQFNAVRYDKNPEADETGVTTITPKEDIAATAGYDYIPYSFKPIQWHTDGYYNPPERLVRSLILHCVKNAARGGENELMDHEMLYILLRGKNPDYIRALMMEDAMTIPARMEGGTVARPDQPGPVFRVDPADGSLAMRYTHRIKSVVWKKEAREAMEAIRAILAAPSPYILRGTLEPGWGLLCNNALHTRAAFEHNQSGMERTMYRIRSFDRLR
ncbi:MAG: TauD/TfdA family dioxygenase [Nitrospinae bacterium]|nr:TauD/TfdA family dioxygenase [Nitrospinota bacterium]